MSYISPIKIGQTTEPTDGIEATAEKIAKYFAGEVDTLVIETCHKVGCAVDKDELEKALRYDRGQYEKGYADGKREAAAAIEALQAQLPKRGEWMSMRQMPLHQLIHQLICQLSRQKGAKHERTD